MVQNKALISSLQDAGEVERQLKSLLEKDIHSLEALEHWLREESDIMSQIDEIVSMDYIKFQCHNDDEEIKARFEYDQEVIMPLVKKYSALYDEFFYDNPHRKNLDQNKYNQLILSRVNSIELFREKNIEVEVQEDKLSNDYNVICGQMMVEWEGEEKTLSQMAIYLKDPDRNVREKAWKIVQQRRLKDVTALDEIMDKMIVLRQQKAGNADLDNYVNYMFKKYERFDYTPQECYKFHDSVLKHVVPLKEKIEQRRQRELGLDDFRPWDMDGVPKGQKPLKPFQNPRELIDKTAKIFDRTDKDFADLLRLMDKKGTLDLESRKAKSPGGFCANLPVSKLSFIFMNASGTQDDMTTLVHEMGHSVHNMLTKDIEIAYYKSAPMESAEFASMGMELISMDKWDEFYDNQEDLKRAKIEQLEGIITFLPWAMVVDKFQHWMYLNPNHTSQERNQKFEEIARDFVYSYVNFEGYEEVLKNRWKSQLHIYEVPFYYIEYAIAQLGAVQIWKSYKENPEAALENYKKALSLGSSKPLPEVYAAAGIKFDFSEDTIKELMDFLSKELEKLY